MAKTRVVNPLHKPAKVLVTNVAGNTGRSFLYQTIRDPTCRFTKIIGCLLPSQREELNGLRSEFHQWADTVEFCVCDPVAEQEYVRVGESQQSSGEECKQIKKIMKSVDYVYLVPTMEPDRVEHLQRIVEAAVEAQVKFVVLVSILGVENTQYEWIRGYNRMERLVKGSGIAHAILRPALFMETLFAFAPSIKHRRLPMCIGGGRTAPVSVEDVSYVAWRILCEPEQHHNAEYDIVGPKAMNGTELAETIGKTLGYRIQFTSPSILQTKRQLMETSQLDEWLADGICDMLAMIRSHNLVSDRQRTIFFEGSKSKEMLTVEDFIGRYRSYFIPERSEFLLDPQVQQFHDEIKACIDSIPKEFHVNIHELLDSILYPLEQGIVDLKRILRLLRTERRSLVISQAEIEDEEYQKQDELAAESSEKQGGVTVAAAQQQPSSRKEYYE